MGCPALGHLWVFPCDDEEADLVRLELGDARSTTEIHTPGDNEVYLKHTFEHETAQSILFARDITSASVSESESLFAGA